MTDLQIQGEAREPSDLIIVTSTSQAHSFSLSVTIPWTLDHSLFAYDCFVQSGESVIAVPREIFCPYNIHRKNSVPTWDTIVQFVKKLLFSLKVSQDMCLPTQTMYIARNEGNNCSRDSSIKQLNTDAVLLERVATSLLKRVHNCANHNRQHMPDVVFHQKKN